MRASATTSVATLGRVEKSVIGPRVEMACLFEGLRGDR